MQVWHVNTTVESAIRAHWFTAAGVESEIRTWDLHVLKGVYDVSTVGIFLGV